MSSLVALPIILPLFGAALSVVGGRSLLWQRFVSMSVLSAVLGINISLLVGADNEGILVQQAGGWPAPMGITLAVDRFSGMMLVVSAIVLLAVMIYTIGQPDQGQHLFGFHPLYLVLAAGISASFITADMFNLFVAFEMMLAASYVLITFGGRSDQVRAGMSYVVISLVASTFFVVLLALLYTATGTLNMADLSERLGDVSDEMRLAFALMMIVVFGVKAAIFPLFFWLPDSYPTAPGPITAIFAGLLTKVGVYVIIRTQTLLFEPSEVVGSVLLWVAALTMIVGVLGALAQDDMKRILAFQLISHIGYMIFGLALFTLGGVSGAIFYIVHHIVVKTALFLVAGLVDMRSGSSRLSEVGGLIRQAPIITALFVVPALSLAGIPPFSGFVGKFALIDAGLEAGSWTVVGVALGVSLLTVFSLSRIWSGVFWSEPEVAPSRAPVIVGRLGGPPLMVAATAALVAVSLAISIFAGPLFELAERAGQDLLEPSGYIDAVLARDS